jgi:hypothetical protein
MCSVLFPIAADAEAGLSMIFRMEGLPIGESPALGNAISCLKGKLLLEHICPTRRVTCRKPEALEPALAGFSAASLISDDGLGHSIGP